MSGSLVPSSSLFVRSAVVALALGLSAPALASSQESQRRVEITLRQAEAAALEGNAALLRAAARQEGAEQQARAAASFVWPHVEASTGIMRTNDPVGVFGTKLRQQRFTEQDFALPALNDPVAVSDWTAGVGAVWTVGDLGKWASKGASNHTAAAAGAQRERAEEGAVLGARMAYLNAVAARERSAAVGSELSAALETAQRVRNRAAEGVATEADRLQADAAVADATARLRLAEASYADALSSLGVHLGWDSDSIPVPREGLPALDDRTQERGGQGGRADLRASEFALAAAHDRAKATRAARLPVVQVFGQLGTNAPGFLDDPSANWTVGVELKVPLFTGFGIESARRAADANARAVEAGHRERLLAAESQVAAARRGVSAARDSRTAARAARQAAEEAARLVGLRYEEGMATLADLLTVQARASAIRAGLVDAEVRWLLQLAQLDYVLGRDPLGSDQSSLQGYEESNR